MVLDTNNLMKNVIVNLYPSDLLETLLFSEEILGPILKMTFNIDYTIGINGNIEIWAYKIIEINDILKEEKVMVNICLILDREIENGLEFVLMQLVKENG